MKNLILPIMLFVACFSFSQLAATKSSQQINLHLPKANSYDKQPIVGPLMILGGGVFTACGLLTPPVMVGGSTTEQKPFWQQGVRSIAIVTGSAVLTAGLVVTICGK